MTEQLSVCHTWLETWNAGFLKTQLIFVLFQYDKVYKLTSDAKFGKNNSYSIKFALFSNFALFSTPAPISAPQGHF